MQANVYFYKNIDYRFVALSRQCKGFNSRNTICHQPQIRLMSS